MKKMLLRIAFTILTLMTLWYLDGVMCVKDEHGINQAQAMYYQPRDTIDVVMLGSSHIDCDIDTGLLWKNFGIAAFDYCAAEQPLWNTYYYLREFCKYQSPKVVVLDLFSPARFKEDYQYDYLRHNLYGMRFSLNKLEMLMVSAEPERVLDFFPGFAYYHERFDSLTMEDLVYPFTVHRKSLSNKGFTPYLKVAAQNEPTIDQKYSGGLTVKSEVYLSRIIEYTKEHDMELFLIVTPYITVAEDELVYNRVREIAAMNDIEFNSTNFDYDEIGLDFHTDFNDDSHLNYWGARKFTDYLGKELKERFEIPDRRGDERYESWEVHYREIAEYVKANSM